MQDVDNQHDFAGSGVISLDVQENDPACEYNLCNIEKICKYLTDDSQSGDDNLTKLVNLSKAQYGGRCRYLNHTAAVEDMKVRQ